MTAAALLIVGLVFAELGRSAVRRGHTTDGFWLAALSSLIIASTAMLLLWGVL